MTFSNDLNPNAPVDGTSFYLNEIRQIFHSELTESKTLASITLRNCDRFGRGTMLIIGPYLFALSLSIHSITPLDLCHEAQSGVIKRLEKWRYLWNRFLVRHTTVPVFFDLMKNHEPWFLTASNEAIKVTHPSGF